MIRYPSLAAIDGAGYDPDYQCTMSFPYEVGILSVSQLERTIELATVEGVEVVHERHDSGFVTRSGRVTASGRWQDVRVLLAALERLARELG